MCSMDVCFCVEPIHILRTKGKFKTKVSCVSERKPREKPIVKMSLKILFKTKVSLQNDVAQFQLKMNECNTTKKKKRRGKT